MNKAITMKKTIRDDDGRDLLRIASDTLPDAGHKAIEAFYTKSDRDFQQSCEKLLLPRAKRDSADERFKPFGAVRRLTIACDTPELLSVVCDVSVYDGRRRDVTRHSESWDRTNGVLLAFSDVFVKGAEKPLLALLREQAVEMQESGKRSHYSNYRRRWASFTSRTRWASPTSRSSICSRAEPCASANCSKVQPFERKTP